MNRNKICLSLKARINYMCKIFNHSLIQSFIPFLEFPECPHQCVGVSVCPSPFATLNTVYWLKSAVFWL